MKVLVTGSSGFLGRHFDAEVIRQSAGHDVWAVDMLPNPWGLPTDVEDIRVWLESFDEDVDLVIHMAGVVGGREVIDGDPLYNADQLSIDAAMFRWAVKHAKTMVYPSSSAVYPVVMQGAFSPVEQLHEGLFKPSSSNWLAPDQVYGLTKFVAEHLAWRAAAYRLNTLCIRPFSGYGPGQGFEYPVPAIAQRALSREDPLMVWGDGTQKRDFIHVKDLVAATFARLAAGVAGYEAMNIGSGVGTDFVTIAQLLAELVGYKPEIIRNLDKPVGVRHRVADTQRMRSYYNDRDLVSLREGLQTVLDDVEKRTEMAF